MSNLKIISDRIAQIANLFTSSKFEFQQVSIRDWSLKINGQPEKAKLIFDNLRSLVAFDTTWLSIKQSGNTTLIYDADIMLNRKFLNVFMNLPKNAKETALIPRLAVINPTTIVIQPDA